MHRKIEAKLGNLSASKICRADIKNKKNKNASCSMTNGTRSQRGTEKREKDISLPPPASHIRQNHGSPSSLLSGYPPPLPLSFESEICVTTVRNEIRVGEQFTNVYVVNHFFQNGISAPSHLKKQFFFFLHTVLIYIWILSPKFGDFLFSNIIPRRRLGSARARARIGVGLPTRRLVD